MTPHARPAVVRLADVNHCAEGVFVQIHSGQQRKFSGACAKIGHWIYTLIVTRGVFWLALLLSGAPARAQNKPPEPPVVKEQEPPEEDPDLVPKEYSFNPLEASRNLTA